MKLGCKAGLRVAANTKLNDLFRLRRLKAYSAHFLSCFQVELKFMCLAMWSGVSLVAQG